MREGTCSFPSQSEEDEDPTCWIKDGRIRLLRGPDEGPGGDEPTVEGACDRLPEPASSWRLLWRRMLRSTLSIGGDDDCSQMTTLGMALGTLRNVEKHPFGHFLARMARMTDSGGPSLPSWPECPGWPDLARMVRSGHLGSQDDPQNREKGPF